MVTISDIKYREILNNLLRGDLSFKEGNKHLIHNLHAFAAKFPPQLPYYFIQSLTIPGETVLDPMVGSGVTIIEAWLHHRNAIGVDLDPLARLISRVRTWQYDSKIVDEKGSQLIHNARELLQLTYFPQKLLEERDDITKSFINFWFEPSVQIELSALILAIKQETDEYIKDLFLMIFSSIIITKSGGVSLARDLAHTRPHKVGDKSPKSPITIFSYQLKKAIRAIKEIESLQTGKAEVIAGDCRSLPLPTGSVDLIVTSPPYANAIDYMRANKFSLVWFGEDIKSLSILRSQYIGSEKWGNGYNVEFPQNVESVLNDLKQKDVTKAKILKKYYSDMETAFKEMRRVLKPERAAIIVVGPSTMRGLKIETHNHLASIASNVGFSLINVVRRDIDRNHRMMPVGQFKNIHSLIEQRIHEEYVIGLVKD